jgi:T4 RnlA family RNA ligase
MEVLEYLKTHSLSDLEKEHGIKVKVYDGFVGLNYSMIDSVKSDPITIECRSLKLQKLKDGFSIASRSFDRFFNYGEMPDKYKHFDFSNALVMEKADGSIIPIWYNRYNSTWEISSRSAIFGESLAPNNITYRQSVLDTVGLTEEEFQNIFKEKAKEDFTYIFEYISPANQIVTLYERNEIVLLGIHHNHTGQYLSIKDMELFLNSLSDLKNVKNTRMPKILKCNSFKEVIEAANRLEKLQEGFVCWDYFNDLRVKVKSKKYVALHHMKLGFGERNLQTYNMKGNNFEHVENLITIVLSG